MVRYTIHAAEQAKARGVHMRGLVEYAQGLSFPTDREYAYLVLADHGREIVYPDGGIGAYTVAVIAIDNPNRPMIITVRPFTYRQLCEQYRAGDYII